MAASLSSNKELDLNSGKFGKMYNNLLSANSKKCIGWSIKLEKYLSSNQIGLIKINNENFKKVIGRIQKKYMKIIKKSKIDNKFDVKNIEEQIIKYGDFKNYQQIHDDLEKKGINIKISYAYAMWQGVNLARDYFIEKGMSEFEGFLLASTFDSWVSNKLKYELFSNIKNIYTKNFISRKVAIPDMRYRFDGIDDMVLLTSDRNDKKYGYILNMLEYRSKLLNEMYNGKIKQILINFTLDENIENGNRYLPQAKMITLANEHVNGGVTITGQNSNMYRKEEFNKVTTHELVHQVGAQISSSSYSDNITNILKYKSSKKSYLLNETYVELLGNILHLIMLPIDTNGNQNIDSTIYFLEIERYWSLWQMAKILNHFGFKNYYEFLSSDLCNSNIQRRSAIRKDIDCNTTSKLVESTNVVSYYINRAVIYCYLNEFLDEFKNYFSGTKFFVVDDNFSTIFENFVLNKLLNQNNLFADIINNLIKIVEKNENRIYNKSNEFNIYKSLRMTATERDFSVLNDIKVLVNKSSVGGKKNKKIRKHQGIVQMGGNVGRLRKGYRYSGKKLKSGLPQIIKCKLRKIR